MCGFSMTPVKRIFLMLILPLIAAGFAVAWYKANEHFVSTDNAYVKTATAVISSDIDGRVVSVAVKDNSHVTKGELLFTLDQRPYEIQRERAAAKLKTVTFTLQSIRAEYTQNLAQIAEAEKRVVYLKKEFERQQDLVKKGVGAKATLDEATHEWDRAGQDLLVVRQRALKVLAKLGGDADLPTQNHPMYLEAAAAVSEVELMLAYTRVLAPSEGVVSGMELGVGEWVEQGRPVFYLVGTQGLWIEANLKETQLANVSVGQSVEATLDAYPDRVFRGAVSHISPATGSEFMVLPAQNATGNWIKVVQRVPVRIELDSDESGSLLRAGMTVSVSINTDATTSEP
ncbi:MAG: membrane fusion protein (multidrug efflux system) [Parasphingorhabdus sp.]